MNRTKENNVLKNVYARYHNQLVAEVCLHTHDPDFAEDCVQDAFCVLGERIRRGETEFKDVHAWLLTIAKNCAKKYLGQRTRESYIEDLSETADELCVSSPDTELELWENKDLICAGMKMLSPLNRRIITLHYINGLSLSETGARIGMSGEAVRKALRRCKEQLKKEVPICL